MTAFLLDTPSGFARHVLRVSVSNGHRPYGV